MKQGICHVEEDPENPGELLLVFPDGLLEEAGICLGDEVVWTVETDDDGKFVSATIKKK